MNKFNIRLITIVLTLSLAFTAFGVVYADKISAVVGAITERMTAIFSSKGDIAANAADQNMIEASTNAKAQISTIIDNYEEEFAAEIEAYKNQQISQKNQEIESLVNSIENSVKQKKIEKLEEYKKKIDEKINKEYNKLIDDLINNN